MDVTKGDIRVFFVIGKGLFYVRRWINHGKLFRRPGKQRSLKGDGKENHAENEVKEVQCRFRTGQNG